MGAHLQVDRAELSEVNWPMAQGQQYVRAFQQEPTNRNHAVINVHKIHEKSLKIF